MNDIDLHLQLTENKVYLFKFVPWQLYLSKKSN